MSGTQQGNLGIMVRVGRNQAIERVQEGSLPDPSGLYLNKDLLPEFDSGDRLTGESGEGTNRVREV